MKFENLEIEGAYLIYSEPFVDDRGVFRRNFCTEEFTSNGITERIAQANISENKHRYTLRGFHYQLSPHAEGKTMTVLNGRIYDIIVDLRKESRTYLKWVSIDLDASQRTSFHVPPGCANAFLIMETNTLVHYYSSNSYNPDSERNVSGKS